MDIDIEAVKKAYQAAAVEMQAVSDVIAMRLQDCDKEELFTCFSDVQNILAEYFMQSKLPRIAMLAALPAIIAFIVRNTTPDELWNAAITLSAQCAIKTLQMQEVAGNA